MASGVTVADGIQKAYSDIKTGKKYRYMIFYIKDEKEIDIEKFGERDETYDDFLNCLSSLGPDKCRYGLYDFEYERSFQGTSESKMNKLILMSWCPDTAKIKTKMLYSTSFSALKQALEGIQKYIQATDMSEASYESVLEKCTASDRA
ncbi:cofilin/actin-depolymerizing factor homolog [Portunus trituberculatus]|uniref:Cofilin/actin-depolymerizing factor n=1 Tax=Portunus trituberculatus TaxID=210409 RepID=A0A5B7KD47_PORTR|nr:cofilin/actin-depolymerizing factor homolog [Portunus trituberculatus]XP_045104948.1 cofilin/actin-depolymerizing factor homolog [Portunus trituberculatus]XP_045104949.1 cofilin/actin-depolymerizing factor homolog [Portunus trituberculatus]MPD02505.1 Cofilin/actin-depolymerizing factor [Portunus trituberculatus]